jgi:catechol 2,3-dioxygenase-like lactoylglutathione lyase family enzyme
MQLGHFSVSLAVKDLDASLDFYGRLGFEVTDGGHASEQFPDGDHGRWRMLRNGEIHIGLFEGMFDQNILTFNPEDARSIQRKLKDRGMPILIEADESTQGPAHLVLEDPDGNAILIDQHK